MGVVSVRGRVHGGVVSPLVDGSLIFPFPPPRMKELIGFSAEEFVGTRLRDYFHPADYKKLIPCEVMCKWNTVNSL